MSDTETTLELGDTRLAIGCASVLQSKTLNRYLLPTEVLGLLD